MLHEYLMFWLRETVSNIARNRLMSALAVSTVAVGLFILGGFYLTIANLQKGVERESNRLELNVYLRSDISATRRKEIYDAAHIPQVRRLTIETREQALDNLKKDYPDLPVGDLQGSQNPLSDVLHIQVKSLEDMHKVRDYMAGISGVKDAVSPSDEVKGVLQLNRIISIAGVVSLLALGLGILLIIHNAIRLTIIARSREINIMELVGATSAFISLPFLMEGVLYGLAGAVLAAFLLNALTVAISQVDIPLVQTLAPVTHTGTAVHCALWLIVAGLAFGLVGSWISLLRAPDRHRTA